MSKTQDDRSLSVELRSLVKWSVSILGDVIQDRLGAKAYRRIEDIRARMTQLRQASEKKVNRELESVYHLLQQLSAKDQLEIARAFTLMLELMNTCENAYRTHRLRLHSKLRVYPKNTRIIYVLTAHPTEARSPDNIFIFHEIQKELIEAIRNGQTRSSERLRSLIDLAWQTSIVRDRKPRVQDEAEHIYSILLRDSNLSLLLDLSRETIPVAIRSWVGGDKDGHPGVNAEEMKKSLQLSRTLLLCYVRRQLDEAMALLQPMASDSLLAKFLSFKKKTEQISVLKARDAVRVANLHRDTAAICSHYQKQFGKALPAPLARLVQLNTIFPGWVVPLEFREDSAILMSDPSGKTLAIGQMMRAVAQMGGDPTWYVRGMIISMASTAEHIQIAVRMLEKNMGSHLIPVVPLFEQKEALDCGASIISVLLKSKKFKRMVETDWGGMLEVMVGYSDSSKEVGVLPSRIAVNEALNSIDRVCTRAGVRPIFFHGSGGSVDRGGGSITDQMSGWPRSALEAYKATIQGEMVERTFASPEILESQLLKIMQIEIGGLKKSSAAPPPALDRFSKKVVRHYQSVIHDRNFLSLVEKATPYPFLSELKIGSRPTRRSGALEVKNLRAIPWILCWTQTRILFPTWWGLGSAWAETSAQDRQKLKKAFHSHSSFRAFIHALGFTLAKIEFPIFDFYLRHANLSSEDYMQFKNKFQLELQATRRYFFELTGEQDCLWYRPWLGKSIELRAPMIHPLNILEVIAQRDRNLSLLRISLTGIASGMLTTG